MKEVRRVPKRPLKRFSCDGKTRHEYEAQAAGARKAMVAAGAPSWRVQVYKCRFCHGWHVGHRPNGGRHSGKH